MARASAGRDHPICSWTRYEKVRVSGAVVSCALLVATGITPDGQRTILGVSVSLSEAEVHCQRDFLAWGCKRGAAWRAADCQRRPPGGIKAGLQSQLRRRVLATLPVSHLAKNMLAYVPPSLSQDEASCRAAGGLQRPEPRRSRLAAGDGDPEVPSCGAQASPLRLEGNVPEGLTLVFDFPAEHRRRLRTNNMLERLNRKEIKRRNSAWRRCSPTKLPCSAWPLRC